MFVNALEEAGLPSSGSLSPSPRAASWPPDTRKARPKGRLCMGKMFHCIRWVLGSVVDPDPVASKFFQSDQNPDPDPTLYYQI